MVSSAQNKDPSPDNELKKTLHIIQNFLQPNIYIVNFMTHLKNTSLFYKNMHFFKVRIQFLCLGTFEETFEAKTFIKISFDYSLEHSTKLQRFSGPE